MNKPLLSICIPTYNRAEYLEKSLDSLIVQPEFSQIEVVISDNASTDDTEEVCKRYQEKYKNIFYYRNKENIHDKNFPLALMRGNGTYRKLFNDTAIYEPFFLSYILEIIQSYIDSRTFLFFLNGAKLSHKIPPVYECDDFSTFCSLAGRWLTWIGGFGLWEDDCAGLENEYSICDLKLWQTYKTLKMFSEHGKAVLVSKYILTIQCMTNKNLSYGVYTVFYKNFPSLLEPYLESGQLSDNAFKKIRKEMLYFQAGHYFFRIPMVHKYYDKDEFANLKKLILSDYKHEPYYLSFLTKNFFCEPWLRFIYLLKQTFMGRMLVKLKRKLKIRFN